MFKTEDTKTEKMQADILLSDAKKQYESIFGSDVWNQEIDGVKFDDYVKNQIKTKLIRVRCMNLMAQEKGVVLSRTQKEQVQEATERFMSSLSQSEKDNLSITAEKVSKMFTEFAIASVLYDDITSTYNIEISADDARVITVQYITADTASAIEAAKQRLAGGESFYTVVKDYNAEDGYETQLKRGEMSTAFENTAYDLKTGETSDILQCDDKYYIIRCTSDNEKSKTESNKVAMIEQKKLDQFNSSFESYEASKYIEFNNKMWKKVKAGDSVTLSVSFEDIFNSCLK
jgi:foldase protein PrsA